MTAKRIFPSDWSKMTDDEVLENVIYLTQNYKKYKLAKPGENQVMLDNVVINIRHSDKSSFNQYSVNNTKYFDIKSDAGFKLSVLYFGCERQLRPGKEKFAEWWRKSNVGCCGCLLPIAIGSALLIMLAVRWSKKEQKIIEQSKQENVQMMRDVLNQERLIQYNDSLKNNCR